MVPFIFVGTRESISNAQALLEYHLSYLQVPRWREGGWQEGLGAARRPGPLVGRVRTVVPLLPLRTAETSERGFGAVGLGPVMFLVQPTSLSRS